jgi:hypothetical protein
MPENLISDILLSSLFFNDKHLYKCRFNNSCENFEIKKNKKKIKTYEVFDVLGLIKLFLSDIGFLVNKDSIDSSSNNRERTKEEYDDLKTLIIKILKNGNCLNYKYHTNQRGVLILDKDNNILFRESRWTRFIYSVLDSFNIIGEGGLAFESVYRRC